MIVAGCGREVASTIRLSRTMPPDAPDYLGAAGARYFQAQHRRLGDDDPSAHRTSTAEYQQAESLIFHLEHRFTGARMLRRQLLAAGIRVGRRHVRTVRRMGMEALCPQPGAITRANQVWALATTCIPMGARFYLSHLFKDRGHFSLRGLPSFDMPVFRSHVLNNSFARLRGRYDELSRQLLRPY